MDKKSKVYILVDDLNRVLRCEGGYTMGNITDVSEWIFIDEGEGDKYNLCQSHYFSGGIYDDHGIPLWEIVDGTVRLRKEDDVAADIAAIPAPPPASDNDILYILLGGNK